MKKKILCLFFLLVSLVGCKTPHIHAKTSWMGDENEHWHECLGCEEILDKEEHTFGEWKVVKEATEKEKGSKERECSVCNYKEVSEIAKLEHEHSISTEWSNDKTNHWKTCATCSELLDKGAHSFGQWNILEDSTESKVGSKERTCTICPYKEIVEIPVKEHTHNTGDWLKDDINHWKNCSICENDVDKGNHQWDDGVEEIIATDVAGRAEYTCEICDATKIETVAAFSQIGTLVPKEWANYERFSIYGRRNTENISIRLVSSNQVFTSENRNSKLEVYFVTGNKLLSREGNEGVTRITFYSNQTMDVFNYGNRTISKTDINYKISLNTGTIIDMVIPYSVLGASSNDIFGINAGLWSFVDNDWAPMMALTGTSVVNVEDLSTYIRCDKEDTYFISPINDYKENVPTVSYNKAELIAGYPYGIADPKNTLDENSDDIYLKTSKLTDSFKFDMVGFGDFQDHEYIKFIIHASETHGSNWNIQEDDVSFLVSKTRATKKTGSTYFWDYKNFGENEIEANNVPQFSKDETGYFTLSFEIDFEEIPNYSSSKQISFIALEFHNGEIYNGEPMTAPMTHNGIGIGDPANQSSYQILQEKEITVDKDAILQDYNIRFSSNYYGKVIKGEDGITLNLVSFKTLNENDFIRFVVDVDGIPATHRPDWPIDEDDVSFTIFKDKAYISFGNTWFWDNESTKFHSGDETINTPTFTNEGEYWTLTLEIQYDELGLNISQNTNLKGILVAFAPAIVNNGDIFTYNGVAQGDIANQANYFII